MRGDDQAMAQAELEDSNLAQTVEMTSPQGFEKTADPLHRRE